MANPGDLDTSFSGDGKRAIDFGGTDLANAVLIQPDGRIVLAGRGAGGDDGTFCVARLRASGALDTTFGSGGKRTIDFGGNSSATVNGAALQPDGKIVVAGSSGPQVAVARLNPNGSLDTAFSGDGKRLLSWGGIDRAMAVLVLGNGKILLGGESGPEGANIVVARLNPSGTVDTSFGTGGKTPVDFGGTEFGLAMARQANGRILVAGSSSIAGGVVTRLRASGALDTDFGGDGRVTLAGGGVAKAVLVQPDRRIVVAGNLGGSAMMSVARLNSNGAPDTTFGAAGTTSIDFGSLADLASDAVLQPDGKIVVAGSTQADEGVAVARLNPDGSPDTTFGAAGKAIVDFGVATFGFAAALQANGRIVVAGQRTGGDDFAVARLLG